MGDGAASQAPALFSCDSEGGAELSEMEMKSGWFGGGHCGCPGQLCGDACPGDRRGSSLGCRCGRVCLRRVPAVWGLDETSRAVVLSLSCTRDQFCGRPFFPGPGMKCGEGVRAGDVFR